ncbi:MAG TPA: type I methionyl aminopeptidase [Acidimicrobiia bacterium]|nr:type I methionyl aminopeptidase [Acidimicrobiia bacterium]
MLRANDDCWCGSGKKYKRCHRTTLLRAGAVGPERAVPPEILRPDYVETGTPVRSTESAVKSPDVIARLRAAGKIARDVLAETGAAVAVGVTTDELDRVAHDAHVARGVYPSPLRYRGFPKSVCTSVNEVICHGIPDDRALVEGDIVNLDITVYVDGVHGDTNATFCVGRVDPESRRLVKVTEECLERGIEAVRPGAVLSDIGRAIETHAHDAGFFVVRAFVGHGIGEVFHGPPQVPHYYERAASTVLEPGMVFTIEPMITMGSVQPVIWPDGWTAATSDGSRTAQFEHTVLVTDTGVEVLTR